VAGALPPTFAVAAALMIAVLFVLLFGFAENGVTSTTTKAGLPSQKEPDPLV
jgi:hypothetical protein